VKKVWWALLLVVVVLVAIGGVALFRNISPAETSSIHFDRVLVDNQGPKSPWGKTIGDVNGDGLPDLTVGGNESGELVWYEAPTWKKSVVARGQAFTTDHAVADIDHDGRNDIVSLTDNALLWFRNPMWTSIMIDRVALHDVEVVDLDGDGDLDIVGRNQSAFGGQAKSVFLYRQGAPDSWRRFELFGPDGEGLRVSDLNGDGKPDLIVNGAWFENPGVIGGQWIIHQFSKSWIWPHTYIAVGDINGDGRADIAMSPAEKAGQHYHLSWFEAPADRTTLWPEHVVESHVEAVRHFIGITDVDNDGRNDLISAQMHQGHGPDAVVVYRNQWRGEDWDRSVISTEGSHSMQIADIDRDGDVDLFGANWSGDNQDIVLWRNKICDVGEQQWKRHVIDAERPWRAIFIASADINGDGLQDIVTGGWWYENPGNVNRPWVRHTIGEPAYNMAWVGDMDGDGFPDILATQGVASEADSRLAFARNNGRGDFVVTPDITAGKGDFLQGVALGHFTNNSVQIALSWHESGNGIQVLTVPGGNQNRSWDWSRLHDESQDEQLSAADIDRDGDTDLLLGTKWLRNDGGAWSVHAIDPENGAPPDRNRLGDINGDGKLDAVVGFEAISSTGQLVWYQQSDDPAFPWQKYLIADVVGPMSVDVADIDGDSDLDVVVGEHNLDRPHKARLTVMENKDGKGTKWTQHNVFTGDEHHDGAIVVDIDGDGDKDIISIGWGHSKVLLYENLTPHCGQKK
jgi:hypothetical protein